MRGGVAKGVHTFPKGIYPKVTIIARLELKLTYYDSAVQLFNHYTTEPHRFFSFFFQCMFQNLYIVITEITNHKNDNQYLNNFTMYF